MGNHYKSAHTKTAFFHCFGCKVGDQDGNWPLDLSQKRRSIYLKEWFQINRNSITFAASMIWQEHLN